MREDIPFKLCKWVYKYLLRTNDSNGLGLKTGYASDVVRMLLLNFLMQIDIMENDNRILRVQEINGEMVINHL